MLGFLCAEFVDFASSRYGVACEDLAAAPCTRDDCSGPEHLKIRADLIACRTGVPAPIQLRGFGSALFGRLIRGYPAFFVGIDSTLALVTRYETQVAAEVRKLDDTVRPPHLALRRNGTGSVEVIYRSTRGLADLAEGLLRGSIAHFGETLDVEPAATKNDGSIEFGFEIDGDVNRFERNLAQGSGEAGFSMFEGAQSTGNRMTRNVALTSEGDGYDLGAGTVFMNNIAISNGDRGIRSRHPGTSIIERPTSTARAVDVEAVRIVRRRDVAVQHVVAAHQPKAPALVLGREAVVHLVLGASEVEAVRLVVVGDVADQDGMRLLGAGDNVSVGNYRDGIEVMGADGLVKGNRSLGNDDLGIEIGAGPGTTIVGNSAIGNDLLDLLDNAVSCVGHDWSSNVFATAAPFCID